MVAAYPASKDERVEALMNHIPNPIADKFIELQVQIDQLKKEMEEAKKKGA